MQSELFWKNHSWAQQSPFTIKAWPALPWTSCSIQVKVMAPSLLLSLNLSRNVPGHLSLSSAFSLSLLMKPMMQLHTGRDCNHGNAAAAAETRPAAALTRRSTATASVSWSGPGSLRSTARRGTISHWRSAAETTNTWTRSARRRPRPRRQPRPGPQTLTLQNLVQGIVPSGFLWAFAPANNNNHVPSKPETFSNSHSLEINV